MNTTTTIASNPRPSTCLDLDGAVEIEVTADFPRETDTGVRGGIDLDITITLGAWSAEGEITLVLVEHDNTWVSYGDGPDTWVSADLLRQLRRAFPEYGELRAVLGKLLDAGRAAVEAAAE